MESHKVKFTNHLETENVVTSLCNVITSLCAARDLNNNHDSEEKA